MNRQEYLQFKSSEEKKFKRLFEVLDLFEQGMFKEETQLEDIIIKG